VFSKPGRIATPRLGLFGVFSGCFFVMATLLLWEEHFNVIMNTG
jgi:hypothetical protein